MWTHIGPVAVDANQLVVTIWWLVVWENLGSTSLIKLWGMMTFAKRSLQEAAHGIEISIVPCNEEIPTGNDVFVRLY